MDLLGVIGLLLLTLLVVGLGLLALRARTGWWVLLAAAVVTALWALGAQAGGGAASRGLVGALPALVYAVLLGVAAVLGERAWRQAEAAPAGRRVAPVVAGRPTTTRVGVAGALVLLLVVALNLWRPGGGRPDLVAAVATGAPQALLVVGLLALAARWRAGFLVVLASQALALLQVALLAWSVSGYFTGSGLVGLLLGPLLQVLALGAVAVWGWREWPAPGSRRAPVASYDSGAGAGAGAAVR